MDPTPVWQDRDVIFLADGRLLETHPEHACAGDHCCIHNPSDHPLRDAPLFWLRDTKSMDRICQHGVYHPDYDDFTFKLRSGWSKVLVLAIGRHDCDGCCHWPTEDQDGVREK